MRLKDKGSRFKSNHSVEDFVLKRLKMAEILIKLKIEGNSNALAFVERTQPYLNKTIKEIRQDIVSEVGELLPQNFKFV